MDTDEINKIRGDAFETGTYFCAKCGEVLEWEDESHDTMFCPSCGYCTDVENYGFDYDEDYDLLWH